MKHKGAIIILLTLICALGIAAAYKYFRFAEEDPAYCGLCHLTLEGYNSHNTSTHYSLTCQTCHSISTLEGNKLILARYVKGEKDIKQDHGRNEPWERCMQCHDSEAAQGSVTFRNSYGHARHVFMHKMDCSSCHTGQLHSMEVSSVKCRSCHDDKLVHGMGTVGLYCLDCHTFGDRSETMQTSAKCYKCHKDLKTSAIMKDLKCHDCHQPHTKLKLTSQDCLGSCHSSETKVGQHSLHMELGTMKCMDCHKPHSWEVTKKNARGLCDRCHKLKDPMTFIY
jgi:hypothetical protein